MHRKILWMMMFVVGLWAQESTACEIVSTSASKALMRYTHKKVIPATRPGGWINPDFLIENVQLESRNEFTKLIIEQTRSSTNRQIHDDYLKNVADFNKVFNDQGVMLSWWRDEIRNLKELSCEEEQQCAHLILLHIKGILTHRKDLNEVLSKIIDSKFVKNINLKEKVETIKESARESLEGTDMVHTFEKGTLVLSNTNWDYLLKHYANNKIAWGDSLTLRKLRPIKIKFNYLVKGAPKMSMQDEIINSNPYLEKILPFLNVEQQKKMTDSEINEVLNISRDNNVLNKEYQNLLATIKRFNNVSSKKIDQYAKEEKDFETYQLFKELGRKTNFDCTMMVSSTIFSKRALNNWLDGIESALRSSGDSYY